MPDRDINNQDVTNDKEDYKKELIEVHKQLSGVLRQIAKIINK